MWIGVAAALGAGLMWGLVFVAPLLLPHTPAWLLTLGRYSAFALVCIPVAAYQRHALAHLRRADWLCAARLSLTGNFLYYFFLSSSIQTLGATIPSLIIGTLPVVIALCAQWFKFNRNTHARLHTLLPAFCAIVTGLLLVNRDALRNPSSSIGQLPLDAYLTGLLHAALAVAAWTWYPLKNAQWLAHHRHVSASTWSTAQGLITLPLCVLVLLAAVGLKIPMELNAPFLEFSALMLALGFFASWLGTLLWNVASQRTPASLMGQLIVFETLSALLYAFCVQARWPTPVELAGITCLVTGVILGIRQFGTVIHS